MARLIDAGFWVRLGTGDGIAPDKWPTISESDQWDEWLKGGTWIAKKGEDFTGSAEEFGNEVWHRGKAANLIADVESRPWPRQRIGQVIFRFRRFLSREGEAPGFSKPIRAHDENGEYLGYWYTPNGMRMHLPVGWGPRVTDD